MRRWLLASAAALAAAGLMAGVPEETLLDGAAFKNWRVECDEGPDVADQKACRAESSGELKAVDGPGGKSLELAWDLGVGDWAQARYLFPAPQDLSGVDTFRVRMRGEALGRAVNVSLMVADEDDVYAVHDVLDFNDGATPVGRWLADLLLKKDDFRYFFRTGDKRSEVLDWTRIRRFFFVVKRPCVWNENIGQYECLGTGTGKLVFDFLKARRGPPGGGDESLLVSWELMPPLTRKAARMPQDAAPEWRGRPLMETNSLDGWSPECDRDPGSSADEASCQGKSSARVFLAEGPGGPAVRLAWDLGAGEWASLRRVFPQPLNLSSADIFGFSLSGSRLPSGASLLLLLEDDKDSLYGYEIESAAHGLDRRDGWLMHVTVRRKAFGFRTRMAGANPELDLARINRFFLCVMRRAASGGAGTVSLQGAQYDTAADWYQQTLFAEAPAAAAAPRREEDPDPVKWSGRIRFAADDDALSERSLADLARIARTLALFPDKKVAIEGYAADEESGRAALAARRARAVRDRLRDAHGVAAGRMEAGGRNPGKSGKGELWRKAVVYFVD